ncbi:MAG: glycoside hydrolase family 16 protein, partial [Lentisphaeria bacterium]|nr:glycoside hydrolase family 16 protein [Lentisphaeria bacterium]
MDTRGEAFAVRVLDQHGAPRAGAKVVRYEHGSGTALDTLTTDAGGEVGYTDLTNGAEYYFEAYYEGANPFDNGTVGELWATATATIGAEASPLQMPRVWPYAETLKIVRVADGWEVPYSAGPYDVRIAPGHQLLVEAAVRNGTGVVQGVEATMLLDRDQALPWDCTTGASQAVPSGDTATVVAAGFTPTLPGVYAKAVKLEVPPSGKTDAWDWVPAFEALDLSSYMGKAFAFSGFQWNATNWNGIAEDGAVRHFGVWEGNVDVQLPLRLRVLGGSGVGAGVESVRSDFLYGDFEASIWAAAPTSGVGTCQGFFYYFDDGNEIDVEILSKDPGKVHFRVQGGGDYFVVPVPEQDSAPHHYGFRWFPDRIEFLLDGQPAVGKQIQPGTDDVLAEDVPAVTTPGSHVPSTPGRLMLNHWSGEPGWSGFPPGVGLTSPMLVSWVRHTAYDPTPPGIDYVRISQRKGTKLVDIEYRLTDPAGEGARVAVVGEDGEAGSAVAMTHLTGDGADGQAVLPGERHLVWDAGVDWPDRLTDRFRVR